MLAGILSFTDKVISEETRQHIKEVLGMTQVGKMLIDEGIQKGIQKGMQKGIQKGDMDRAKRTALNMLKRGDSLNDVADVLEFPVDTIKAWKEEALVEV